MNTKQRLQKSASRIAQVAFVGLLLAAPAKSHAAWQLVWSDEFSQADGSSPDPTKWTYDIGTGCPTNCGWGNNELEYYTSRTNNARIENGNLVIEARIENYGGRTNTSARMKTQGKWSWTYGRIEARIKLPRGQGIWPAFWMLGTNIDSVGWPTCGEIDIMENIGNTSDQGTDHGTIHGPQTGQPAQCGMDYNCYSGVGSTYTLPGGAALADDFHIFAVEWTTNQIKWYCDSNLFFTATPASLPGGATWVFSQPQFLILNVAVGGNWPGYPDGTTVFPQQMLVDYVHVYKYVAASTAPDTPTGFTVSPGDAKVYLSWSASTSDATGYNVKRATNSGGPYATVASPTANNYTDTGIANCATYYYVVSATNSFGESTNSGEQAAVLGGFALAVKPGSGAVGQFVPDTPFVAGGTIGAMSYAAIDTSGLMAPAPEAVYQSERYGNFTYTFAGLISNLNYKVRLHFAETYWSLVGQRRFNVFINGAQVLTNFDIIATAGAPNKATIQEFTATPISGQIVVQYITVTDNARADGVEILLPQSPAPTAGNNGPIWSGMTLNLTASSVPGATYNWTGPDGFVSTAQNPSIANASTNASGLYGVTVTTDGCSSTPATTMVTVNPPASVSIQSLEGNVILTWPGGTLQSATNVLGPWNDLSAATSPQTNPVAGTQEFYRLKLH